MSEAFVALWWIEAGALPTVEVKFEEQAGVRMTMASR
jgi:hypothetical protein